MFTEIKTSDNILEMMNVCPDFKLTQCGPSIKNTWTQFADHLLLTQPEMDKGINPSNYQYWLDWTYETLSESNEEDPVIGYVRDLRERADDRFEILFFNSFRKKGFADFVKDNPGNRKFKCFTMIDREGESVDYERELVRGRFGSPVILERSYQNEQLAQVTTLYFDSSGRLILKLDDAERWGYQQWQDSLFHAGDKVYDKLSQLNRIKNPLDFYLLENRYLRNINTGEIATLRR